MSSPSHPARGPIRLTCAGPRQEEAHSKAIVVSANGDPTEYQEMAKSGTPMKMIVADGHEFVAPLF